MSATQRRVYKSSDLSRAPGDVFDAASDHPVELTRRDGDSLFPRFFLNQPAVLGRQYAPRMAGDGGRGRGRPW